MLVEIVQSLSKEEVRAFKLMVNRIQSNGQRTTLQLFDLVRQHPDTPSAAWLSQQLYQDDRPASRQKLYLIRSKLLRELKRFLLFHHFDLDQDQKALMEVALSRIFRKKGQVGLARELLDKAGKGSEKHDLFAIKELSLKETLTLAAEDHSIDVPSTVQERSSNLEKLQFLQTSQNAMAFALQKLRRSNFANGGDEIMEVMRSLIEGLEGQQNFFRTAKGRIRLFNLTSNLLLQQGAFQQLETYLYEEYAYFQAQQLFTRENHRTKLIMLVWLINVTFNNLHFEASLQWCATLKVAMEEFQARYQGQFSVNYFNSLVNNYLALRRYSEAQQVQEELAGQEEKSFPSNTAFFIHLNLSFVYYTRGAFRKALQTLARIRTLNAYHKVQVINQIQLDLFELVLRHDSGDFEYLDQRWRQIKLNWSAEWDTYPSEAQFLEVMAAFCGQQFLEGNPWENPQVTSLQVDPLALNLGQAQPVDYRIWLASQEKGLPYHEVVLEMIREAKGEGKL